MVCVIFVAVGAAKSLVGSRPSWGVFSFQVKVLRWKLFTVALATDPHWK